MGLLDTFLGNADQTQALSLLGANMMAGNTPQGLLAASQYMGGAKERAMKQQMMQAQLAEMQAQADERRQIAAQRQAEAQRQSGIQAGLPSLFRQPGMTGGEAVPQQVGGVPMFSQPMGAAPMRQTPGGFDMQRALTELRMKPDEAEAYAKALAFGKPKVARTVEVMRNNKPTLIQLDESGQEIGAGYDQWKAPVFQNLGGRTAAIDPVSLGERGSFGQTMSPSERDASARGWASERRQAAQADLGRVPSGYRANPDGTLSFIPGGPADPARNGEKMPSEGERKAATLLKRLEGSQQQLTRALGTNAGAAKPELIPSAIRGAKIPFIGGIPGADAAANTITSQERQRVEAAQLDMLDAALTLGTGAAYTREQLEGYRQSYFPQIGDDAKNVRDKQERLQNVIEAAKIAAGRAGPGRTGGATASFDDNDPLGLRK